MEVRFENMVCLWDDKIPTMFLEFMNLLTFCQSEEQGQTGTFEDTFQKELLFYVYLSRI